MGVWTNVGDTDAISENTRITSITSAASSQPKIRYTSSGFYEMQLPSEAYARLILSDPNTSDTAFRLQSRNAGLTISGSRADGYQYSELGWWARADLDFGMTADFGTIAFGTPTPASGVPVTGSATYEGIASGATDVVRGGPFSLILLGAEGTVTLGFNFGTGTLGGEMALSATDGVTAPIDLGTFTFTQTVFSSGSTAYSGKFDTSAPGFNFFNGLFTGPNVEETIGSWALPFRLEGADHQAIGAWIAKKGN